MQNIVHNCIRYIEGEGGSKKRLVNLMEMMAKVVVKVGQLSINQFFSHSPPIVQTASVSSDLVPTFYRLDINSPHRPVALTSYE